MSNNDIDSKISRLIRFFGNQLDRDVLASVLEMHDGNVQQAIDFIQLQNNQQPENYYDPFQNMQGGESIPKDYFDKPYNWVHPTNFITKSSDKKRDEVGKLKKIFLGDTSFEQHLNLQSDKETYHLYVSVLISLLHVDVQLSHATKARILAAALGRRDKSLSNYLLNMRQLFQLPEVLKALKILDAPRKIRQLQKKIDRLKSKAKKSTIGKLVAEINESSKELAPNYKVSVSGALCRKIRKWVGGFDKEQLQFFALHLPKEPWKELADIVHFNPKDFQLDWFLPVCFGADPPKGGIIEKCKSGELKDVLSLVKQFNVPYSYLRKNVANMSSDVKIRVCEYESLDTVLWYYEELISDGGVSQIDSIIAKRLEKGETPQFSYGKLMERLLTFKMMNTSFYSKLLPIAEKRLDEIQLILESPVVIFGDASYSMDCAIRTSTIIASVVAALTDAELKFFNVKSFASKTNPKTVAQVLEVTTTTKAYGLTAPACTLVDYYNNKKPVKLFVMVTDEIENQKFNGTYFAQLFYRYYRDVYPAKLVMVSFLENPQEKGRMVKSLENLGIDVLQFRLDSKRPDLTKLDKLLGMLSSETAFFVDKAYEVAEILKKEGLDAAVKKVKEVKRREKAPVKKQESSELQIEEKEEKIEGKGKQILKPEKKEQMEYENLSSEKKLELLECNICMDRRKDTVLNCGHVFCETCVLAFQGKCPNCDAKITATQRIFL